MAENLTTEELLEVKKRFEAVDVNGDGMVCSWMAYYPKIHIFNKRKRKQYISCWLMGADE